MFGIFSIDTNKKALMNFFVYVTNICKTSIGVQNAIIWAKSDLLAKMTLVDSNDPIDNDDSFQPKQSKGNESSENVLIRYESYDHSPIIEASQSGRGVGAGIGGMHRSPVN